MTTIAANRTSIACDRQFTHSGTKFKGATKCFVPPKEVCQGLFQVDKVIVGACGSASGMSAAWAWLSDPTDKPKVKGCEFLLLSEKGIFISENLIIWLPVTQDYYAIGTGMQFAQAAMAVGASPKEAVAVASKHDPMSGMGVKEYTL